EGLEQDHLEAPGDRSRLELAQESRMRIENHRLRFAEIVHGLHEPEPALVLSPHPPEIRSASIKLREGRSAAEAGMQRFVLPGDAVTVERLEEVDQLQVEVDVAACRELE